MGTGYTVILDDDHQGYVMSGVFAAKPTSYTDLYSTGYTSTASLLSDFEEQVEIQLENTMLSDIQTSSDADTLFTAINVTYFGALGLDWDMYNSYIAEDSTLSSSIKAMLFSQKINMADINTIQDIFVQILEDNNPFDLAIIHAAKSGALVDLNNATLASTRSKLEADPFKFTSDDYDYWRLSDIGKNKVAEVVYNAKVASGSYTSIDG
ncbi:MAG: hypothetical protein U9Q15_04030 [Patescibacteria group bacterium]|nr:hypothetical protein [Patescibacteria group bacterium]